ncbi:aspartate 1-decarboxylase [Rhodococcus hoagii]|nr:aspartate 1-decarboxylase [Prescottella equi]
MTVDQDLMEAADLLEGEQVTIVGHRHTAPARDLVITGERGGGVIGIKGAAAHMVNRATSSSSSPTVCDERGEVREYAPRVVFVDGDNKPVELGSDPAHAPEGSGLITPGCSPSGVGRCSSPSTSGTPTSSRAVHRQRLALEAGAGLADAHTIRG